MVVLVEVDAHRAVVWTAPEDHKHSRIDPFSDLGMDNPLGFHTALAGWPVRTFARSLTAATLLQLFQKNDGHEIGEY